MLEKHKTNSFAAVEVASLEKLFAHLVEQQ
jgi:hypothetical protein